MLKWLGNCKLQIKFVLIGAISIPFILFLGITAVLGVTHVNELLLSVQQKDLGAVYYLSQTKATILEARIMGRQSLLEENPTAIQTNIDGSKAKREQALEKWQAYLALPMLSDQTKVVAKSFDTEWQRFVGEYDQIYKFAAVHSVENQRQGVSLLDQNNGRNLVALLDRLITLHQGEAEVTKLEGTSSFNTVLAFIVGASILAMLMTFLAVLIFARSITVPVSRLHRVALDISRGNLERRVEINSTDELGQLAKAFNQMTMNLELAQRNRLAISETVNGKILVITSDLRSTAYQQSSGSQEQVSSVLQINQSVTELSQTAGHIFKLAEQVSQGVAQSAQASLRIQQTTSQVLTQVELGREAVTHTLEVSQQNIQFYQRLVETVQQLTSKTARMQAVVALLDNIARETHLLSLNAAIEAAGLGGQGGRFRVIAQEIKTLAANSGTSSRQVGELMAEIQDTMDQVLDETRQGQQHSQEMEQTVNHAAVVIEVLSDISHSSAQQAHSITRLAQQAQELASLIQITTAQQNTASQQVLSALSELSVIARQSSEGSSLVSETSSELEKVTQELSLALTA